MSGRDDLIQRAKVRLLDMVSTAWRLRRRYAVAHVD
jgi:hypothetical protein